MYEEEIETARTELSALYHNVIEKMTILRNKKLWKAY